MPPDDITILIKQLATDNIIQKFYPLDTHGYFICVSHNIPIIIGSANGFIDIHVEHILTFDYDLGFIGRDDITTLNKAFLAWKRHGDITVPIINKNDLTK
jgi:hypothetical protein